MAEIATSPFATSHDTIGQSHLGSLAFMPSSPPRLLPRPRQTPPPITNMMNKNEDKNRTLLQTKKLQDSKKTVPYSSSSTPKPIPATGLFSQTLDTRLAGYIVDLSKFPGGGATGASDNDNDHDRDDYLRNTNGGADDDRDSEPAGPEDFTMNLTKYILGSGGREPESADNEPKSHGAEQEEDQQSPSKRDADAGDESEFGPPVDMSTPSHLIWRKHSIAPSREGGTQLEGIEEDTIETLVRRMSSPSKELGDDEENASPDDTYALVMREIDHLRVELKNRDEQIMIQRKRIAEAASLEEEVKYLRSELERKSSMLLEDPVKGDGKAFLRNQIQALKADNDAKRTSPEKVGAFSSTQKEAAGGEVGHELCEKIITTLRQQLSNKEDQLKAREEALEETMRRLQETTSTAQVQLRQKDTEIENLKAQIDDDHLEMDKMETNLQEADENYKFLENRIESLESRNQPLEEKNILLETEVAKAKAQINSQERALSILVADLAISADDRPHHELMELLKDWCQSRNANAKAAGSEQAPQEVEERVRLKITSLESECEKASLAKQSLESELQRAQAQTSELQLLTKAVEAENARLSVRLEELNCNLDSARADCTRLKDQHAQCEAGGQSHSRFVQQSPSSPNQQKEIQSLQAQIQALQSAHSITVSNLEKSHSQTTCNLRTLLTESEEREQSLHAEIHDLHIRHSEIISSQATTDELREEIRRLESMLQVKDEAAADMDEWIAEELAKREHVWERRIKKLLHERDRMGKAILLAWGEKELGKTAGSTKNSSSNAGLTRSSGGFIQPLSTSRSSLSGCDRLRSDSSSDKMLRESRSRGNILTNSVPGSEKWVVDDDPHPFVGNDPCEMSNTQRSGQAYRYKYVKSSRQQL